MHNPESNPEPKMTISMKALINVGGSYLFLNERIGDHVITDLPGGTMEFGERPEETLVREVYEETGLRVRIERILGVYDVMRVDNKGQIIACVFLCYLDDESIKSVDEVKLRFDLNPAEEYFDGYQWLRPEEFAALQPPVRSQGLQQILTTMAAM